MSELFSILFAAIFASSIGLDGAAERSAKAEIKAEQHGVMEKKLSARLDFKQAENRANADYKASISVCRKKPAAEKKACLEEAKTINEKAIVAAKEKMDKAVAEARMF